MGPTRLLTRGSYGGHEARGGRMGAVKLVGATWGPYGGHALNAPGGIMMEPAAGVPLRLLSEIEVWKEKSQRLSL